MFLVFYLHITCCHFAFENDVNDGSFLMCQPVPEKLSGWPIALFSLPAVRDSYSSHACSFLLSHVCGVPVHITLHLIFCCQRKGKRFFLCLWFVAIISRAHQLLTFSEPGNLSKRAIGFLTGVFWRYIKQAQLPPWLFEFTPRKRMHVGFLFIYCMCCNYLGVLGIIVAFTEF